MRYVAWDNCAKDFFENEIEAAKKKDSNENIVDVNRHVEFHEIDKDKLSAEDMLSWVKSSRSFKRSATKGKSQGIRNFY